jgi:hypothetical protein
VPPTVDYVQLAIASTRRAFVSAMPYTFIVSDGTLARPAGPARTAPMDKVELLTTQDDHSSSDRPTARVFMALAIRKVNDTFPHMIAVGRTANNDLVVPDVSISKFHAFFTEKTVAPGGRVFELVDAGSKNGTWVSGIALAPRGAPVPVKLGDRLRFGRIEFTVVDAGACWDTIERMRR